MTQIPFYLGAALLGGWGISHLVPTRNVVAGFGEISEDNRNIITMEWLVEGVALIFLAALLVAITVVDPTSLVSTSVYVLCVVFLVVLAIVSMFTGFRIDFLPFKLCPVVFLTSAGLIILGMLLRPA